MSVHRFRKLLLRSRYNHNYFIDSKAPNACIFRFFTSNQNDYVTDPAPLFFKSEIQKLLKTLTRIDLNRVYVKRKLENKVLTQPTYRFMTDEQLQETLADAQQRANNLLQMPPVVKVRTPINRVIFEDSALKGFEKSKFIFTDVTYGIKDDKRLIVVRDTDGVLKEGDWDVRDRMNQVYFPKVCRLLKVPKMFDEEYLQDLLKRGEYKFILDRACAQFEPDHPDYHRVTSRTYEYINENNGFEKLRSTRHFGPLTFYLTWFKVVDNLLLELIETSNIEEANTLLQLYEKVHTIDIHRSDKDHLEGIKYYIAHLAHKRSSLELALQSYKDLEQKRNEFQRGIQAAHGNV